jgi:hypothetical protein
MPELDSHDRVDQALTAIKKHGDKMTGDQVLRMITVLPAKWLVRIVGVILLAAASAGSGLYYLGKSHGKAEPANQQHAVLDVSFPDEASEPVRKSEKTAPESGAEATPSHATGIGNAAAVASDKVIVKDDTPKPVLTTVLLFEHEALEYNKGLSPVDKSTRLKSYSGKQVNWIGLVNELDASVDSEERYYQVFVSCGSAPSWSGSWCFFPRQIQPTFDQLKKGDPVRISGVFNGAVVLPGFTIEKIARTSIGMKEYLDLLESDAPQIQTQKEHVGKYVAWTGDVHSIDAYPDDPERAYRILLVPPSSNGTNGYIYCYLSEEAEPVVAPLAKGTPVALGGVLQGRTDVELSYLKVDESPRPKHDAPLFDPNSQLENAKADPL